VWGAGRRGGAGESRLAGGAPGALEVALDLGWQVGREGQQAVVGVDLVAADLARLQPGLVGDGADDIARLDPILVANLDAIGGHARIRRVRHPLLARRRAGGAFPALSVLLALAT